MYHAFVRRAVERVVLDMFNAEDQRGRRSRWRRPPRWSGRSCFGSKFLPGTSASLISAPATRLESSCACLTRLHLRLPFFVRLPSLKRNTSVVARPPRSTPMASITSRRDIPFGEVAMCFTSRAAQARWRGSAVNLSVPSNGITAAGMFSEAATSCLPCQPSRDVRGGVRVLDVQDVPARPPTRPHARAPSPTGVDPHHHRYVQRPLLAQRNLHGVHVSSPISIVSLVRVAPRCPCGCRREPSEATMPRSRFDHVPDEATSRTEPFLDLVGSPDCRGSPDIPPSPSTPDQVGGRPVRRSAEPPPPLCLWLNGVI